MSIPHRHMQAMLTSQDMASPASWPNLALLGFWAPPAYTYLLGLTPPPRVLEWRQEGNQGLGEKLPTHYGPGALTRPTLVCVAQCISP